MSPRQTATPLNVAAAMDATDERQAALYRRLARGGHLEQIDAIFGEQMPALLMGSSPRMKRGA